jgi:deoxycytidine triphosphate deaminase
MKLLRDEDLVASIDVKPPLVPYVEGIVLPANVYSNDSPIQGSSIDLHIGNIYLPGTKDCDIGGAQTPKLDHVLQPGETVVVTTKETLHLPSNVAGFGFPPSKVSFGGLLMTNPGHVDPGYDGVLRFTVINMSNGPYPLERGKAIVTLLLFGMEDAVHSDWHQRNPGGSSLPSQEKINKLSKDFLDVERRAKRIARAQGVKWSVGITAAVGLIVGIFQLASSGHLFNQAEVENLKKRQEIVEYDLKNRVDINQKLQEFDNRLKDLERTGRTKVSDSKKTTIKTTGDQQ